MNIVKNKIGWRVTDYREYVYELEQELARQQRRAREHRRNIRAMQKILAMRNDASDLVSLRQQLNKLKEQSEMQTAIQFTNTQMPWGSSSHLWNTDSYVVK